MLLEIIYIYIFVKMQGFERKQIKQRIYSLFAVSKQTAKAFAVRSQLVKRTRGAQLCNLATAG